MMKRITVACVLVLMSVSMAFAEWLGDFRDTYVQAGIDKAVENALKGGANPDLIVENGMKLDGLNPQNLVKALYCAGAKGIDIRAAAEKWNISEVIVAAGFKKSIEECKDVDAQAYTPVASDTTFPSPSPPPPPPASPSNFR
jgi:hypothetical protein